MTSSPSLEFLAGNLQACPDAGVAIAASRWGATGLLNLEDVSLDRARAALDRLLAFGRGTFGVKLDGSAGARSIAASLPDAVSVVVLTTSAAAEWPALVTEVRRDARRVLCECTSEEQVRLAIAAGADGVVAKGGEAGGHVGDETTFVLVQRLIGCGLPVWAAGGIGLHTAAACHVAGCAGIVIDAALALTRESSLPAPLRAAIERSEGDDTACAGASLGDLFRMYRKGGSRLLEQIQKREHELAAMPPGEAVAAWRSELRAGTDLSDATAIWPLGQDASFAAPLARRYRTVAAVLDAFRASIESHVRAAQELRPLAPDAPLARSHGTTYPILQGPMTRVSDTPEFADAVSAAGALPFLALALMRGSQVRTLLERTRDRLGDRPWGVGILGFVPPELRQEQLEVVHDIKPAFALIAGGRPDQAASLEREGITTYLHVPSPGLLRAFVEGGARRFVFEGRECGGHVGPRTSFVLWTAMIDVLLEAARSGVPGHDLHVAFAGGVHDARSTAMVAALSAPLAAAGVRVGVLIGTAYLFTEEAVASRAIGPVFQREALDCTRTVLFETAPGHAIRCADTPYFEAFRQIKRQLASEGRTGDEVKETLESLNLGRLRLASKGILRETDADGTAQYADVAPHQQRLDGMYMLGQVAALRQHVLRIHDLHRHASVGGTALLEGVALPDRDDAVSAPPPCDVAIVGAGCILPGAADVRTFWSNVLNKRDAVTEVPPERFDAGLYFDPDVKARDRIVSKWGGFMGDVPFDPVKYGIPPSALGSIDSLQLLALEAVDQALSDAGLADREFPRERASVIFGTSGGLGDLGLKYGVRAMLPSLVDGTPDEVFEQLPEWTEDSFAGILLNVAAGRVANRFNFGGVNYTVDAACASSLAAVQLGAAELQRGTSDVVVVGGVDTVQTPFGYLCFSKSQALSPRGRCRTFDQSADGIAISEGVVALVIKRLADAERDGDRIYAVVKAVAGSSDGRGKGLTAPRPEGQMRALRRAYAQARIKPSTVGLIEAHGTGTVAGDAAEVAALDEVFRADGATPESCAIGSVKSMIGHTKASAGVAGLLKAALALHHQVLPPTLHVETPNARLREGGSPFYLNTDAAPWMTNGAPRRAGVSSFGFGGTNFHAVLEEYTGAFLADAQPGCDEWPAEIFLWGAPDAAALREAVAPLRRVLGDAAPPSLRSLSSAVCRACRPSAVRGAVVAASLDDLRAKLGVLDEALAAGRQALADPRGVYLGRGDRAGRLAFLFPGQGSQVPGMLRDLAVQFAEVRDTLDRFGRLLDGRLAQPLTSYIYPPATFTADDQKTRARALTDTRVAQPALGAVDTAVLELLAAFGVSPEMAAGHSYGEYVALHAAGVIDEATLATLSERRGRAIAGAVGDNPGAMAAASADPAAVRAAIGERDGVWLANFNAPQQTIVAGVTAAVDDALAALTRAGISARLLPVACAFHTPLMHAARARFDEALASAAFAAPRIPVYSNTLAAPYPDDPVAIARVLSDHLEAPVQFVAEIRAMYDAGARIFVEVGPRGVLTALTRQIVPDAVAIALDHADRPGVVQLLHGLAQLAASGVTVDPARLFEGRVVEALDSQFKPIERRRPAAWVVNGAGARPATAPAAPIARPKLVAAVPPAALAPELPSAGVARAAYEPPVPPPSPEPFIMDVRVPAPSVVLPAEAGSHNMVMPAAPAGAAGIDTVMLQFQQVMSHFLHTQGAVMSAYLGNQTGFDFSRIEKSNPVSIPQELMAPLPTIAAAAAPGIASDNHTGFDFTQHEQSNPVSVPQPVTQAPAAVDFTGLIVRVAAERTGYAPEMLDLDLGIEADLGIDSIKRVEILSSVRRQCSDADQQKLQPAMDTLTRVKTLREMAAAMTAAVAGGRGDQTAAAPDATAASVSAVSKPAGRAPAMAVAQQLLQVVSDRTGYPVDMLGIDLNIEADLGIDSIKRVEILTTFRQQRTADEQTALHGVMDQLTRLKTLRELSSTIERALGAGHAPAVEIAAPRAEPLARPAAGAQAARLPRVVLSAVDAPPLVHAPSERRSLGVTLVTDDGAGTANEVCARLDAAGDRTVLLRQRVAPVELAGAECFADWTDATAAACALARIREAGPIAALVHVAPLAEGPAFDRLSLAQWQERIRTDLRQLQILVQAVAPDLRAAGRARGAAILAATALGGDFGESGRVEHPTHGGIIGYLRTAAIELPEVRVRVVDVEPRERRAAQRIVSELDADGPVEIGYRGTRRLTVALRLAPATASHAVPVDADSVVLLTGGARGITAELAVELASRYRPTLVLAGLSVLSATPEDPATVHLEGATLKAALAAELGRRKKATRPVDVDAAVQRIVRQREIRRTIAACEAAGSRVEYQQVDVRSESAVSKLLDGVYARHQRLDVVVHGAGIIEDKLIQDKTVESFDRVVHTKADSVFALVRSLRHDRLRALVLMSSVTAAFGNRGQADYGAANGIYNAMAQLLAARSGARVVAMNWGPWDKLGMASEEVRRQFLARGITPIDPALGVRAVLDELASGQPFDPVVVLGDGPWAGMAAAEGQVEMLA